jgi:hypothetical protein
MERGKAMAKSEAKPGIGVWSGWRAAAWGGAALILLLPLVAMQLTDGVDWAVSDFVFAALLIGGVGLVFELTVRMTRNHAYRAGIGSALASAFLLIWANGAVGMIGSERNPFNLLFAVVVAVALVGALAARFRAAGMARSMIAAAATHVAVSVVGVATDPLGGVVSAALAGLWLLSALLFRNAALEHSPVGSGLND